MKKYADISQGRPTCFVALGFSVLMVLIGSTTPQMAFAITITATATGNTNPPTAQCSENVTNGDFLIGARPGTMPCVTGNGIDELTTWTFDFRADPDVAAFPAQLPLTSARLTLVLTPKSQVVSTDTVAISGLRAIITDQIRTLPVGVTSTIELNLLEFYNSDAITDVLGLLAGIPVGVGGQIPMRYIDDAVVSFARLELTDSAVPAACSEVEVPITSNSFIVLPTVSVVVPEPRIENEQCKITFSTEVATSESDPQLLGLGYAIFVAGEPAHPEDCTFFDGPILTQVVSGLDETHTFISVIENTDEIGDILAVTPCIRSEFGGQFRLRRHCLIVECLTR